MNKSIEYDDLSKQYEGYFGRYQKLLFVLLATTKMFTAFQTLSSVFVAGIPEHRCDLHWSKNFTCNESQLLDIFIPKELIDGHSHFSQCYRYSDYEDNNLTLRTCPSQWNVSKDTTICTAWHYDRSIFQFTIVTEVNMLYA